MAKNNLEVKTRRADFLPEFASLQKSVKAIVDKALGDRTEIGGAAVGPDEILFVLPIDITEIRKGIEKSLKTSVAVRKTGANEYRANFQISSHSIEFLIEGITLQLRDVTPVEG